MNMRTRRTLASAHVSLLLLVLLLAPASLWAEFQDPLDHSAVAQPNLTQRPMMMADVAANAVVAVGPRGLIVVSQDDGKTWKQVEVPVQSDLVAVDFSGRASGWAVGHDGVILHSADSGLTWTKQLDGRMAKELFTEYYQDLMAAGDETAAEALELTELNYRDGPALPFLDVWFENENRGFAVGAFGLIAATSDGGKTWEPWMHRIANDGGLHLNAIERVGEDIFIASERGYVFKLDRGQQRFASIETSYPGTYFGVAGNDSVVIAYGLRGSVLRSVDGGESWQEVSVPSDATINYGLTRPDGGFILANQAGELLLGDSSAEQFKLLETKRAMHLTSVVPLNERHLVATALEGFNTIALPAAAKH